VPVVDPYDEDLNEDDGDQHARCAEVAPPGIDGDGEDAAGEESPSDRMGNLYGPEGCLRSQVGAFAKCEGFNSSFSRITITYTEDSSFDSQFRT